MWHPFLHWFLLLGAYIAIQVSKLSPVFKNVAENAVVSLFVLSLTWTAINLSTGFIKFYLRRAPQSLVLLLLNLVKATIAVIALLTILDAWGAPTEPIILVLITGLFIAWLVLKDNVPNLLAGLEIVLGGQIKVGHFIKLESGETGSVCQISWMHTTVKTPDETMLVIPNNRLLLGILFNYGNDAPKAKTAPQSAKRTDILSEREREVLILIGRGATNREIAQKLVVSEHTVKSHLRSILSKLNIRNRQQAAVYAEREGLVRDIETVKSDSQTLL